MSVEYAIVHLQSGLSLDGDLSMYGEPIYMGVAHRTLWNRLLEFLR